MSFKKLALCLGIAFLINLFLKNRAFASQTFNFDTCTDGQTIAQCYPQYFTDSTYNFYVSSALYFSRPKSIRGQYDGAWNGFRFYPTKVCSTDENRHRVEFYLKRGGHRTRGMTFDTYRLDASREKIVLDIPFNDPHNIWFYYASINDRTNLSSNLQADRWYKFEYVGIRQQNPYKTTYKIKITDTTNNNVIFDKTYEVNSYYKIHFEVFNDETTDHIDDLTLYCENDLTETGNPISLEYREFNTSGWVDESLFVDLLDTIKQFTPQTPNAQYYKIPTSGDIYFKASFLNQSWFWNYKINKLIFKSAKTGTTSEILLNLPWLGQGSTSTNILINNIRNFFADDEDILDMKIEILRNDMFFRVHWYLTETLYFPKLSILLTKKDNPAYLRTLVSGRIVAPNLEDYLIPIEDCNNAESLTDKVLCSMRNLMIEIFVPKISTLQQLDNQVKILTQKFPFNIFFTLKNFFGEVANALQSKTTIKMFNAQVEFSPNYFSQFPILSTIYSTIKLFFNGLLVFAFVFVIKKEVEILIHSLT
jgi:hypothetical protein